MTEDDRGWHRMIKDRGQRTSHNSQGAYEYTCIEKKNKAGYTATLIACEWAGAVMK